MFPSRVPESADSSHFSVDAVSGRVTTLESLDRDVQSLYVLRVWARDGGRPARSTPTAVEVRVGDDPPPLSPAARVAFTVREDTPPGSVVGTLTAADMDSGGRVSYHLVGGSALGSFG